MPTLYFHTDEIKVLDRRTGGGSPVHLECVDGDTQATLFLRRGVGEKLRDDLLALVPLPDEVPDAHAEATARETDGFGPLGGPPASEWVDHIKVEYRYTDAFEQAASDDPAKAERAKSLSHELCTYIAKHVSALDDIMSGEATARETDGDMSCETEDENGVIEIYVADWASLHVRLDKLEEIVGVNRE